MVMVALADDITGPVTIGMATELNGEITGRNSADGKER